MFHNPKNYTVESVTSGHPDKVCDQISDAVLDACLAQDPLSRMGAEACAGRFINPLQYTDILASRIYPGSI